MSKNNKDDVLLNAINQIDDINSSDNQLDNYENLVQEIGAIKAFNFNSKLNELFMLKILHRVKTNKAYKEYNMTWAQLMDRFSLPVATIDRKLKIMDSVGRETFGALTQSGVRYKDIAMLSNADVIIEEPQNENEPPVITVGGRTIVITEDNKNEVKELITELAADKKKVEEKLEKSKEKEKEKEAKIQELTQKVSDLETPVDLTSQELEKEIGLLQAGLIALYGKYEILVKKYQDKPKHIAIIDSSIAKVVRFSEMFAALVDPTMDEPDVDLFETSPGE